MSRQIIKVLFLTVGILSMHSPIVMAKFAAPQLEVIPVQRLIDNLTAQVKAKPQDAGLRRNLARAHAMAWSNKGADVQVNGRGQVDRLWFGYTPKLIPFHVVKATDEAQQVAARNQLDAAIAQYREAMKLAPKDAATLLGLAWVLDQADQDDEARKLYRQAIDISWKSEGQRRLGPLGGNYISVEAGQYLLAHLHPKRDANEIREIQARKAKLERLPRPVTPIAIPLQDGLTERDIHNRHTSVAFDADGAGLPTRWTWLNDNAGWLVYDAAASGQIESATQLFGNVTFMMFWQNGYDAMATLDDDGNGVISGRELRHLAIWRDRNGNGLSESGEVRPLSRYGIRALRCAATTNDAGALFSPQGVVLDDGTTRPTFDVVVQPN